MEKSTKYRIFYKKQNLYGRSCVSLINSLKDWKNNIHFSHKYCIFILTMAIFDIWYVDSTSIWRIFSETLLSVEKQLFHFLPRLSKNTILEINIFTIFTFWTIGLKLEHAIFLVRNRFNWLQNLFAQNIDSKKY